MPLENNMKTPHHFIGSFRVLNTAMTMIISIYALVGFFGFLKYGFDVEGSISLNLPTEEGLVYVYIYHTKLLLMYRQYK